MPPHLPMQQPKRPYPCMHRSLPHPCLATLSLAWPDSPWPPGSLPHHSSCFLATPGTLPSGSSGKPGFCVPVPFLRHPMSASQLVAPQPSDQSQTHLHGPCPGPCWPVSGTWSLVCSSATMWLFETQLTGLHCIPGPGRQRQEDRLAGPIVVQVEHTCVGIHTSVFTDEGDIQRSRRGGHHP